MICFNAVVILVIILQRTLLIKKPPTIGENIHTNIGYRIVYFVGIHEKGADRKRVIVRGRKYL